jgi:hypothetical protein
MTLQMAQRGKEYLKTAQTLLHIAKTLADKAIAAQLKDSCRQLRAASRKGLAR